MIRQTLGLIAALSVLTATSSRLHRTIPGSSGKELAVGLGDLLDAVVSQESARATERRYPPFGAGAPRSSPAYLPCTLLCRKQFFDGFNPSC